MCATGYHEQPRVALGRQADGRATRPLGHAETLGRSAEVAPSPGEQPPSRELYWVVHCQ